MSRQSLDNIYERVRAHGIPSERIEDNDVIRIHERVGAAVTALREGGDGPYFFECMTYRWKEHVGPNDDFVLGYREEDEATPWKENDQVDVIGARLAADQRAAIEEEVEAEVAEAFAFAEESPFPTGDELFTDVYK